jgi:uncharacterized protein YlzI (FlbEa/FlbD family)
MLFQAGMIQVRVIHATLQLMLWINPAFIASITPTTYGALGAKITMSNGHSFDVMDQANEIFMAIDAMKRQDARLFLEAQGIPLP